MSCRDIFYILGTPIPQYNYITKITKKLKNLTFLSFYWAFFEFNLNIRLFTFKICFSNTLKDISNNKF